MNKVKLFFTNKPYRWSEIQILKIKILSLPVVSHIYAWYQTLKNMNNSKTPWERHQQNLHSKKVICICNLINLKFALILEPKNEELFGKVKAELLSNWFLRQSKYDDFREWLEKIDVNEKDYSRVQELIDSLTAENTN